MQSKHGSLKIRLTFFSGLLVIFVAGILSFTIREGQKKAILENQANNRDDMARALRQVAREAVLVDDDTGLVNYVNLLQKSQTTAYAMVLNPDGKVRVHTNPLLIGNKLTDVPSELALAYRAREKPLLQTLTDENQQSILDLSIPIIVGASPGEFKGIARIGFDKEKLDQLISDSLEEVDQQIQYAFWMSLALGLIGAYLLALVITRPIQKLKMGAEKIGQGKLGTRIDIRTNDELHDLADEFNLMAQKLGELDELKQDFVSNVTHELRSPMTSIRGYIDLLMGGSAGPINALQKDYLSVVKNSALRLGRFIDNLLDVAKIEANKLKLTPEIHDAYEAVHEMEALFKPQLDDKKIRFANRVPATLSKVYVDKDKLSEVLINLTSNAIKFTPEGGAILITATEGTNHIEMSVQDSGAGIPADMIGKIFNKFEQVKSTQGLARNQKGTGLGLTIAKGIVEAHGGKIWIKSPGPSGRGTAFFFTIPKLTPELEAKINAQI
jgi:signal transduction histidine kinase